VLGAPKLVLVVDGREPLELSGLSDHVVRKGSEQLAGSQGHSWPVLGGVGVDSGEPTYRGCIAK